MWFFGPGDNASHLSQGSSPRRIPGSGSLVWAQQGSLGCSQSSSRGARAPWGSAWPPGPSPHSGGTGFRIPPLQEAQGGFSPGQTSDSEVVIKNAPTVTRRSEVDHKLFWEALGGPCSWVGRCPCVNPGLQRGRQSTQGRLRTCSVRVKKKEREQREHTCPDFDAGWRESERGDRSQVTWNRAPDFTWSVVRRTPGEHFN